MFLKAYFAIRKILDKRGVGTVEILIILAVLVALALIFRQFIIEVAERIFDKIRENADKAIEGL
ncbi:MAG TPA: Flp1 family type IVb pilin [Clostridia bacterium]|jgi:competence protein ComGC|nr:multidrug transporter [Clostridiaceae bacterium]HOA30370.1 Flp1 family type IVb pilin [Clostridia bacterium]HPZ52601.1 Flp1 family type IVb pilin [Clostridia bacterium]